MNKEEYLKLLSENEIFKAVLSKASDSAEKKVIKNAAEDFIMKFYDQVIEPISRELEKDPDALKNAYMEIEKDLINNSSGSQDPQ